jgi:hypothetical protein
MSTKTEAPQSVTEFEAEQVGRANASTSTPVVFVHGLAFVRRFD